MAVAGWVDGWMDGQYPGGSHFLAGWYWRSFLALNMVRSVSAKDVCLVIFNCLVLGGLAMAIYTYERGLWEQGISADSLTSNQGIGLGGASRTFRDDVCI